MSLSYPHILALVEYVTIDRLSVVCHFKCQETNKKVVSAVAFEPYRGKIKLPWYEILLHPIKSYKSYYHTPIVIYSSDTDETIVFKAFQNVSNHFIWNRQKQCYIYH